MSTPARADAERFLATICDRSSGLHSGEDAIVELRELRALAETADPRPSPRSASS